MANLVIPQDIIDNIIEAVGDDRLLLKKCSLVSSSFLLPSRKHLFSNIYLKVKDDHKACKRLHQVLVENPDIQSFVRSIFITSYKTPESHSLIAILQLPFCCLESFSILMWRHSNWNDFSSELKDAVSTITHSSTLKTLFLHNVTVPIMLFHGIHLTKLELRSLFLLNDFDGKQSRLLTSAASEGATASHPVIDQCSWAFYGPPHGLTEPIFLPFMCHLRVFEIYVNSSSATMSNFDILSFLMGSLRVSITSPSTLEYLKFDIVFTGDNHPHEPFDSFPFLYNLREADFWSHIDSIITHPTGSRLQRVDIYIAHTFREAVNIVEPVLAALPRLREKGILFVKELR